MEFAWYNHNMYDTIFIIQYMILLCKKKKKKMKRKKV